MSWFVVGVWVLVCVFVAGKKYWRRWRGDVSGLGSVGVFCVYFFAWVGSSDCPMSLVGKLPDEAVTYVSSSPVRTYFRCDLASVSAWCWAWLRVGMCPWYMVVRFMRSMRRPQAQPSVCWEVLWMWIFGVSCLSIGGAMSSPVYH